MSESTSLCKYCLRKEECKWYQKDPTKVVVDCGRVAFDKEASQMLHGLLAAYNKEDS